MSSNSKNPAATGHPPGNPARYAHLNQLPTSARNHGKPSSAVIDGWTRRSLRELSHVREQVNPDVLFGAEVREEPALRHADLFREDAKGDTGANRLIRASP
jgi:hypothetical protein